MPIPPQRDPEATRQRLTGWLARKMPDARGLSLSVPHGPEATGFSTDTMLFDATWDEGGASRKEGLVARAKPTGFAIFPEYAIAQQFEVMRILGERTDVPVPKVWWLEEDESVLGAPFYVMSRVDGRIPGDNPPYTMEGWLLASSAGEQRRLWETGLDVMARIHRLDWRALGLGFVDRPEHGPPGLDAQLRYQRRYLEWAARGRAQPVTEAAFEWIEANRPSSGEPLGLCWGDSRIGNMIFDDHRCVAVLDWEMATLGNPVQDLAWWLFLDRHHSEGLSVPRLPGFPSREETIARWEELTGSSAAHVDFYEVFAGFRFAIIMMRVAQMLVEYELLPPDSDMETNNVVTQLLAKMLGLPAPGS